MGETLPENSGYCSHNTRIKKAEKVKHNTRRKKKLKPEYNFFLRACLSYKTRQTHITKTIEVS